MGGEQMQKIVAKLGQAAENLMTVKVVTVVGPLNVTGKDQKFEVTAATPPESKEGSPYKALLSTVNIVEGDIVNAMDEVYVTSEANSGWAGIRTFHERQVDVGVKKINENIQSLIGLIKSISSIGKE